MGKSLNVLMIGNSFSICVGKFLPQMVRCFPGNSLKLTSCYIGGCSFETYTNNIMLEFETLSPFETVAAGGELSHTENWSLLKTQFEGELSDDASVEKLLSSLE